MTDEQVKKLGEEMLDVINSMTDEELQRDVDEFNRKRRNARLIYTRDYIIDNSYFKWLEEYKKAGRYINGCRNWGMPGYRNDYDKFMCEITEKVVKLIAEYSYKHNIFSDGLRLFYVRYNDKVYEFYYSDELGVECEVHDKFDKSNVIDYEDFRKFCKKNMNDNFDKIQSKLIYTLNNSDTELIKDRLSKLKSPTLVSGVGGSSVVADFASKVIAEKNGIVTKPVEPRDIKYMSCAGYKNILSCSYGGSNYGVDLSFDNKLKHYLLSSKENNKKGIINITYKDMCEEKSFTSINGTILPCAILLNYYLDNNLDISNYFESNTGMYGDKEDWLYEIFSGADTSTPCKYLESTLVETGMAIPVVHDKYSYCHGRSMLSQRFDACAIYFNGGTDFDKLMLDELPKYYNGVIVFDYKPGLEEEFKLLLNVMDFSRQLAIAKGADLSGVEYGQLVRKLYKYNGNI